MGFEIENGVLKAYRKEFNVTSLSIPDGVQEIGDCAVACHDELTSISIPDSVQKIGYHAFYDCPNLTKIQVSERNSFFTDIDGILYDREKKTLLYCPNGLERIHLPEDVTRIEEINAFAGCQHLKEITVEQNHSKYKILNSVLYEYDRDIPVKLVRCPVNISEVQIPETVREISPKAFEYCSELTEISIPERVTEIQQHTFHQCDKLKDVHLHSGITHIRENAFSCSGLKEMILPDGVTTIENHVFSFCSNLEKLVIPESVNSVGFFLMMCPELRTITCHNIPVPHQHYGDVNRCIWMIVRKNLDEPVPPVIKYTILYLMLMKKPGEIKINTYIQEHFTEIITEFIQAGEFKMIQHYLESFQRFLTAQKLDEFIRLAIDQQKYEIQVYLTDLKYQRNDFKPRDWSL